MYYRGMVRVGGNDMSNYHKLSASIDRMHQVLIAEEGENADLDTDTIDWAMGLRSCVKRSRAASSSCGNASENSSGRRRHEGAIISAHPHWQISYFGEGGELIAAFGEHDADVLVELRNRGAA
jgi:hypothetical protein